MWTADPLVGISLVRGAEVVTWLPPGDTRYRTEVSRQGRLLSRTFSPDGEGARAIHAETAARIESLFSQESLRAVSWLRQGILGGYLKPSGERIDLSPRAGFVWRQLGPELRLGDAGQEGLTPIEVGHPGQLGVGLEDGLE